MRRIAVLDLGMGNLRSVERALERAAEIAGSSVRVLVTSRPEDVRAADAVVLPGQGAFRDCASALAAGFGEALREQVGAGKPYLGICLGLQALFDESDEAPGARGLGLVPGRVVRLPDGAADPSTGEVAKVPHVGWNEVMLSRPVTGPLAVCARARSFYFVHAYHAEPRDPAVVAAVATHGPHHIVAAAEVGPITAVQFHPEKSQSAGLALLAAFVTPNARP